MLYRPRSSRLQSLLRISSSGYIDGVDYWNLIPKLDSIANLPDEGWLFKGDPQAIGIAQGYFRPNHATGDFNKLRIGVDWDSQGYSGLGQGWYRLRYKSPPLLDGRRVFLHFGGVDESAWLYIDGKLAAWYDTADPETTWDKLFLLEVTGSFKSQSEHVLANPGRQHYWSRWYLEAREPDGREVATGRFSAQAPCRLVIHNRPYRASRQGA